ncbi:hypothetical protein GCG54_00005296 [Colletotrichum gloeosporioides]|uniref:Heterokaryon incompatibility domain-containing protein n=1 Tax=Colletotrichum gloeosporioides TaxID=474922 RepID=A0A8H4CTG0_COLGL|nr:uncharacterized protein GCG54_00005296 [Colletotrichum gloeosporioides]KAF3809753.1 hypothetical protein GCG54_00005296 [Colletotrichum gloeosporioides]
MSHLLRSEIPYDALPLAFREALSFTQALGLNFIWIDCLCIIQEGTQSQQDWTAESSKMESVFSNCDICLSLYRARSPHESILNGPVPQFTAPFEINTTGIFKGNDDDGNGSTKCAVFSRLYFKNALFRQPLGSRAWALQERLLPDRLLGFGAGELFWSCKQMPYACESMPYGAPDRSQSLQVSSLPSTSDFIELSLAWFDLVEEYTRRELTYPEKDKLAALSAVASSMQKAMGDEYLAGHFLKSIAHSLVWHSGEYNARRTSQSQVTKRMLRLPSWSWASVDGRVWFSEAINLYRLDETLLAHTIGYHQPPEDTAAKELMPSVVLNLSAFRIEGQITRFSGHAGNVHFLHSFDFKQLDYLVDATDAVSVMLDNAERPIEGTKVMFCPMFLLPQNYRFGDYDKRTRVHGVFQVETELEVDDQMVYERIGVGYILLKLGVTWQDVVDGIGMERTSVLLG